MKAGIKSTISAEQLHTIIDTSVDGFTLMDNNGRLLDVNDGYCTLTGYSRDELINMHMSMIEADDSAQDIARRSAMIMEKGSVRFETRHICKDGSIIDVEVSANYTPHYGGIFFSFVRDISGQNEIKDALNKSEERYRNIVETQAEFVDRFLPGGILTYVNPALANFSGMSVEELIGKSFYPFIHEDDRDEIIKSISEISVSEPRSSKISRIVLPDGKIRWASWTQTGIFDDTGTLLEYQSVGKDITDLVVTETALRESEQKYRLLFENSGDSISVLDMQGTLLAINPMSHKMLGYTYDELMALPVDMIDTRPEKVAENMVKLMTHGYYNGETEFLCKDGTTVAISVHAKKINWDGIPAILSTCRDITEKKKNMQALDYVSKCFNQALNGSQHILYRLNVKKGYDYLSPAFEKITGYPLELFKKVNLEKLAEYFHPDDIAPVLAKIDEACRGRKGPEVTMCLEYRLKKADDSYCWLYDSTTACFDDNDELEYYFGSAHDITERKKSEEERLELERQLLHAQKLESLGVMAGGIAHDFNNLLQAINGNLELASFDMKSGKPVEKYISNAMKSSKMASQLTSLMLTYAGKGFIAKKNVNINDIVKENAELLRTAATSAVSVDLFLSAELPEIVANEGNIQQLIMNLISNGAESIENTKGRVTISTGTTYCDQEYLSACLLKENLSPGKFVYLDVKDNGCGMSKETLSRLFDPFFTTKFIGRGLGMSAVMGIMKSHNGALCINSEPGKGTTFRALFPLSETPPPEAILQEVATAAETYPVTEKILTGVALVVDDEKNVLRTSKKMLELCGFTVITAYDGVNAVCKFREHAEEINIVLMDLTMPNMDGITAMNEIYNIRPNVKMILSSGFNKDELSDRITGQVPAGFIRKPYSMAVLETEVCRVMRAEINPAN